MVSIRSVDTPADVHTVRALLREYGLHLKGALGSENMNWQRFEQELATLPQPYEILLLGFAGQDAAGCVLLKAIGNNLQAECNEIACELKRLWVRPQFRGLGIGRRLTQTAMAEARLKQYTAIYLDTVPFAMQAAHRIYQYLGFSPVERYNDNPVDKVQFFRRDL